MKRAGRRLMSLFTGFTFQTPLPFASAGCVWYSRATNRVSFEAGKGHLGSLHDSIQRWADVSVRPR